MKESSLVQQAFVRVTKQIYVFWMMMLVLHDVSQETWRVKQLDSNAV